MTVSGVFSAWARLPAWRRASSACTSLCSSSCVQLLGHRLDLARQPLVDPRLLARSGSRRSPAARGAAATGRKSPAARRGRSGRGRECRRSGPCVCRSTLICSSSASRFCATWKRQRHRRIGQPHVALDDPQASRRGIRCCRRYGRRRRRDGRRDPELPVPQRARGERLARRRRRSGNRGRNRARGSAGRPARG